MAFFHWLTLLFIGCKLTGHIDWSWWRVLSPSLGLFALTFIVLALVAMVD